MPSYPSFRLYHVVHVMEVINHQDTGTNVDLVPLCYHFDVAQTFVDYIRIRDSRFVIMIRVLLRGMTVDTYKNNYIMFRLLYAFHQTPFGKCLIAVTNTDEELAYLTFVDDDDETEAIKDLKAKWPLTRTLEDTGNRTGSVVAKIFPDDPERPQRHLVRVLMKGTEFQIKVWKSLIAIPMGTTTTYEEVAWMTNCKAAIAVGSAISKNYVAYVVPCHRVTAKHVYARPKYAWGMERKRAIQEYEKELRCKIILSCGPRV